MSKRGKESLPAKAIKFLTKRYTEKAYQRHEKGRLVRIASSADTSSEYEVSALEQATALSVSTPKLVTASEPVSRARSLDDLYTLSTYGSLTDIRQQENLNKEELETAVKTIVKSEKVERKKLKMPNTDESETEHIAHMLNRLGLGEKDNYKQLPPLPYFNGAAEKVSTSSTQQPWIEYNCDDFVTAISDAVDNDKWTEGGKLKTLQDRLLGSARTYWNIRSADVNTLAKAKEYLLRRYPSKYTHASLDSQIATFKRQKGEIIPEMATRIQLIYTRLAKVTPETKNSMEANMKELFLRNLPEVVRDHILATDTFDDVVSKAISYLERHKELRLRDQDILLENTFKTEAKMNNVNVTQGKSIKDTKQVKGKRKRKQ